MSNMATINIAGALQGGVVLTTAGVIGVPVALLTRQVVWCGKKVLELAEGHATGSWAKLALKIAGAVLLAAGVVSGVAVGAVSMVSTSVGLGTLGSMTLGPVGSVGGFAIGIIVGMMTFRIALGPIYHQTLNQQPQQVYLSTQPMLHCACCAAGLNQAS